MNQSPIVVPFSTDHILCQLYLHNPEYDRDAAFEASLPARVPIEQNGPPTLIDNRSRKRYCMMNTDQRHELYSFNIGQELRIRIRNRGVKDINLCVLFQSHTGIYYSIFPHFLPRIRNMQDLKELSIGKETVLSIPTELMPDNSSIQSGEVKMGRIVVVISTSYLLRDIISALRKRMADITGGIDVLNKVTDGHLAIFHYKFQMKKE